MWLTTTLRLLSVYPYPGPYSTAFECVLRLLTACSITAAGTDLNTTLPLLSAYLVQASANYTDARPCLIGLLARLQHINATVIVLPSSLEVSVPSSMHVSNARRPYQCIGFRI